MNDKVLEESEHAKVLAAQPYNVIVVEDETTEGQLVYLASIPELEGCMGQGLTLEEALADLEDAKFDYINSLLIDGLQVPLPSDARITTHATTTSSSLSNTFTINHFQVDYQVPTEKKPHRLFDVALQGDFIQVQ